MGRDMCWRCFWPRQYCWCPSIQPQETKTKFVFLMHPKEFKQEKAATGRLAHLSLGNSIIRMGLDFSQDQLVQDLLADPSRSPVLLYPGASAIQLSEPKGDFSHWHDQPLTVFLLDGTWATAKSMFKANPDLQKLPRIMFKPSHKSLYQIKRQPQDWCLSTLEACHELLLTLTQLGLDDYPRPTAMIDLFRRMQDFQIVCAAAALRGVQGSSYRQRRSIVSKL